MEFGKDDDDDDDVDDDHYYRFDINEKITPFVSAEEQVDPKTAYRWTWVLFPSFHTRWTSVWDFREDELRVWLCWIQSFRMSRCLGDIWPQLCIREPIKAEYDIYIMGKLTVKSFSSAAEEVKRKRYCYNFNGQEVCKDCFLCIYNLGEKRLKNIVKHISAELEYCQMARDHTRSLVDGEFGRIKQLYRRFVQ